MAYRFLEAEGYNYPGFSIKSNPIHVFHYHHHYQHRQQYHYQVVRVSEPIIIGQSYRYETFNMPQAVKAEEHIMDSKEAARLYGGIQIVEFRKPTRHAFSN